MISRMQSQFTAILVFVSAILTGSCSVIADDHVAKLQTDAIAEGKATFGHWGTVPDKYTQWRTHSNRLIPVYTFGTNGAGQQIDLTSYTGEQSPYRSEDQLRQIYSRLPERTVNPNAVWMDQTNIADIQRAAAEAGKKHIFLFVFDGMDWDTTRAASIFNQGSIAYTEGRGQGTHFQTYNAKGTAQFGFMVTSPHNNGTKFDATTQTVENPGGTSFGGYDATAGGAAPWETPADRSYLISKPTDKNVKHAYTDSASSATSMTAGIKTYNGAIGVGPDGAQVSSIAHELQQADWSVGVVSSVPLSHATPAAAYAHNVARKDYQDISRDMLGLPSVSHPDKPLPGLDVIVATGFGTTAEKGETQGDNFEPGNLYLADSDLKNVQLRQGGQYITSVRKTGTDGSKRLQRAASKAAQGGHRLLGFYGMGQFNGHLPFETADGDYKPVPGNGKKTEIYTDEDLKENPTLEEMTTAALTVLESRKKNFWLLVEAGDVDWANHDNNLDSSIGAVNSGDRAVKVITNWVEKNSNWDESVMIVTADHGHLLVLTDPQQLTGSTNPQINVGDRTEKQSE